MTLRESIITIIESKDFSSSDKALMILLHLEYDQNLSLSGNGWIDDDDIALEAFGTDQNALLSKMRSTLGLTNPTISILDIWADEIKQDPDKSIEKLLEYQSTDSIMTKNILNHVLPYYPEFVAKFNDRLKDNETAK